MHAVCRTQLKRNLRISFVVILILALIATLSFILFKRASRLIDPAELPGQPQMLPEEYGYTQVSPPQGGCTIRLCGNPWVDGKDIYLYLTNLPVNSALVRAEVYRAVPVAGKSAGEVAFAPGDCLGSTGFIHPNAYVECLTLDKRLKDSESRVYIKIATRNQETGQSEGFFYISTELRK